MMPRSPADTAAAVRREYERLAGSYDRRWARYEEESLALLRPHLAGRALGDVLDIGCGTGELLPRLAAWGAEVGRYVGIDPSPSMLRQAVAKAARAPFDVTLEAAEAEALPVRGGSIDTAVTASALHYWCDVPRALGEVRRVLRPGGRLLLLDWSRDALTMRALNLGMRAMRVAYDRMWSAAELRPLLMDAGFRVESEERRRVALYWHLLLIDARPI